MLNTRISRIIELTKQNYNSKLVKTLVSILEDFGDSCPCVEGGFTKQLKPINKCPLDLFKGIDICVSCEFSRLWYYTNSFKRSYEYSYLIRELKKLQKDN